MSSLTDRLIEAQKKAMAIRPKVGGFPVMAEVFRQATIELNVWWLPSCQSIYYFTEGTVVQQGEPLVQGLMDVPEFNEDALIAAIRADQAGKSTFPEFLKATWAAGIISYQADFIDRKVTYFGADGESYEEDYPEVDLSKFS